MKFFHRTGIHAASLFVLGAALGGLAAEKPMIDAGSVKAHPARQGATVQELFIDTGNFNYKIPISLVHQDGGTFVKRVGLLASADHRHYSERGFYGHDFIHLFINGENVFQSPVEVVPLDDGVGLFFSTSSGPVSLKFRSEKLANNLFVTINLPEKRTSSEIGLTCYPGDFKKNFPALRDKWIATKTRQLGSPSDKGRKIHLTENEPWIFFFDKLNNPLGKSHLSTCALLYDPREQANVDVFLHPYYMKTTLSPKNTTASIHLVLWEFPGQDHFKALDYMRELKIIEQ